ncbi:cobQ/CobB/MinD/ParA nucleotide binding domain protein [Burkholderia pseudomallei MSHR1328]|nr:cobQ/CobB/MinD/ParA nucleotide binding domain protein [Burkholderia pseudomallei MSHR1328]
MGAFDRVGGARPVKELRDAAGGARLVAIVADAASDEVIRNLIADQAMTGAQVARGGIDDAIALMRDLSHGPQHLLVDVSGAAMPLSDLARLADVCDPSVNVIVIGERNDVGLFRSMLRIGVRDYLVKPLTVELVHRALSAADPNAAARAGKAIGFVGARGGVGVTSIAVALARHLADRTRRRVAYVDFDCHGGAACSMLGVVSNQGLVELLQNPQRLDAQLIHQAMVAQSDRLFVLSAELPYDSEAPWRAGAVAGLVGALRHQFHYVLLDLPERAGRLVDEALAACASVYVVADRSVHAAREAARLLHHAQARDGDAHVSLILNNAQQPVRGRVEPADFARAVGRASMLELPYEPQTLAVAENLGAALDAPRGDGFAAGIGALAQGLTGADAAPAARRPWYARLAGARGRGDVRPASGRFIRARRRRRRARVRARRRAGGRGRGAAGGHASASDAGGAARASEPAGASGASAPGGAPQSGVAPSGHRPASRDDRIDRIDRDDGHDRAPAQDHHEALIRSETFKTIRAVVFSSMNMSAALMMSRAEVREGIEQAAADVIARERLTVTLAEQTLIVDEILNDMFGVGPIEPLLADERVTDILVNGPDQVYVERAGKLELTPLKFRDNAHVINVAQRIAAAVGRRVDESSPMVDARLADGSRVNVVLPPIAIRGASISIRKFAKRNITLARMAQQGNLSQAMVEVLKIASACRLNIVISGGTGSGKTTLLNALSHFIDSHERIVTIEDAAELQLQQPHVVSLETRPENSEGLGGVSQRDLVRNALRMRPDRIILGETRGPEAFDVLQAMNTGHDGSMTTIHANTPRDAITRLESMVMMANGNLPLVSIRRQIASAVHMILQIERMRDGVRRVTRVTEIAGMEGDVVITQDLFAFRYDASAFQEQVHGMFESSSLRPAFAQRAAYYGLEGALLGALQP